MTQPTEERPKIQYIWKRHCNCYTAIRTKNDNKHLQTTKLKKRHNFLKTKGITCERQHALLKTIFGLKLAGKRQYNYTTDKEF